MQNSKTMKKSSPALPLYFHLLLLFFFAACNGAQSPNNPYLSEINKLTTDESKKNYLEKIFEDDQNIRQGQVASLKLEYGKDSKEYTEFVQEYRRTDSINLLKVENYLSVHGHPKKSKLGEIAAITPWVVIHHYGFQDAYEVKEKYFSTIYKAYKNGDLSDGEISFYLNRMYSRKYSERLRMESPYTIESELDTLISKLNLDHLIKQ